MTINDLLAAAGRHGALVLAWFVAVPTITWGLGRLHTSPRAGATGAIGWGYAAAIYGAAVPGMLSATLVGYSLLFLRVDLRAVPIVLYFVPIASMIATWAIARRQVALDDVPGFDRLSGLMWLLFLCFAVAFVLNRIFFGVFFLGSLWGLALVALAGFFAFRIALRRIAR